MPNSTAILAGNSHSRTRAQYNYYNHQNTATQLSHRQLSKNEEVFGYGKLLRNLNRETDINHRPYPLKKLLILS
jgi:hypothetical protein